MKRTIIGCCLTIIGALGYLMVMIISGMNLVSSWYTPPGRLMTTIADLDLTLPFVVAIVLLVLGLIVMAIEYFKKD